MYASHQQNQQSALLSSTISVSSTIGTGIKWWHGQDPIILDIG